MNWKGASRTGRGGRRLLSPEFRRALALRVCSTTKFRPFRPTGASGPGPGVRPASRPCVRKGRYRQPGSFRPGNAIGGGARANGLMAGSVGASRRSRWARICLITAGSSMLAITFTAPPQCSHVVYLEHARQPLRLRLIETCRGGAGSSVVCALRRPRRAGVTFVQRFEHHVRRAIPAGRFQTVANIALGCKRQAFS